jgi:hypothetical protein
VKEGTHLAKIYKNKSVAEQNSGKPHENMMCQLLYRIEFFVTSLTFLLVGFGIPVDIALDLLMDESFDELRATIYATDDESKRFRQLGKSSWMAHGSIQSVTWFLFSNIHFRPMAGWTLDSCKHGHGHGHCG